MIEGGGLVDSIRMRSRSLTALFGIQHAILQGGLRSAGLQSEIRAARGLTERSFELNVRVTSVIGNSGTAGSLIESLPSAALEVGHPEAYSREPKVA